MVITPFVAMKSATLHLPSSQLASKCFTIVFVVRLLLKLSPFLRAKISILYKCQFHIKQANESPFSEVVCKRSTEAIKNC